MNKIQLLAVSAAAALIAGTAKLPIGTSTAALAVRINGRVTNAGAVSAARIDAKPLPGPDYLGEDIASRAPAGSLANTGAIASTALDQGALAVAAGNDDRDSLRGFLAGLGHWIVPEADAQAIPPLPPAYLYPGGAVTITGGCTVSGSTVIANCGSAIGISAPAAGIASLSGINGITISGTNTIGATIAQGSGITYAVNANVGTITNTGVIRAIVAGGIVLGAATGTVAISTKQVSIAAATTGTISLTSTNDGLMLTSSIGAGTTVSVVMVQNDIGRPIYIGVADSGVLSGDIQILAGTSVTLQGAASQYLLTGDGFGVYVFGNATSVYKVSPFQ